ncbi:MAG: hypothetical protein RL291_282 [Pseudomonadota bacterium]
MANTQSTTAPQDGRQSEAALAIARGTQRLFAAHGHATLPELTLPNGRRADLMVLGPKDEIAIVEIKSSIEDFRSDQKWPEYREFCDTFWFAVAPEFPLDILPDETGIIVADRYGAEFHRHSPLVPLNAARRRALMARFGRVGALRLQFISDPEASAVLRGIDL